jgi:hypothetical protein
MNERALKCPNAKVNLIQKGFTYHATVDTGLFLVNTEQSLSMYIFL